MATPKIAYDVGEYQVVSDFIHNNEQNVIGIRGPLGSGKSTGCCIKIHKNSNEMPPGHDGIRRSRWLVVRNTYRELKDTTIKTWQEWVQQLGLNDYGIFRWGDLTHTLKYRDVELEVLFRSMESDDDIRKILSLEISGAWINEAREIDWVIMKNIRGRLGRYPRQIDIPKENWWKPDQPYWTGIIMDTNSPSTNHWWYKFSETPQVACMRNGKIDKDMLRELNEQFKFYAQPGGMHPDAENIKNLPPNYYRNMMTGADEMWINVYVNNNYGFIMEGKEVYPEYQDVLHCTDDLEPIPGLPIIRGWDFGLTPACIFAQHDHRGRLLVFDELFIEDMGVDRFSDVVLNHSRINYGGHRFVDYGDPAGAQRAQTDEKTCFQILTSKGILIEPSKQDLKIRIESVKKTLNTMVEGTPGFMLHKRCQNLRDGFLGGYQYRKIGSGDLSKYNESPDKNKFSHPHDALQYIAAMTVGQVLTEPIYESWENTEDESYLFFDTAGRDAITGY